MAQNYTVGMVMLHPGTPGDREARERLVAVLPDAQISEPDDIGIFAIALEANDQEQALEQIWDALAASATDDHIVFLEHAELPERWRPYSGQPS